MSYERAPAVAGTFYPGNGGELRSAVEGFLAEARIRAKSDEATGRPKALIVPHAGYVYSGAVAASAYARLAACPDAIERVVLLGPSHRVWVDGLAVSGALAFRTPLGSIRLDRESIEAALALRQVGQLDEAHRYEHSLEVQLPFLQVALGDFALVPFSVGQATPGEVAEVLDLLWGGPETLVVISTDLSHFHDYDTARELDAETSRRIEALRADDLDAERACGCVPLSGILTVARRRSLEVRTLDVRNSGDTAGSRNEVVGYGSYAVA